MAVIPVATMFTSISGAVAYSRSYFGRRSSPPFMTGVYCYGSPSRILDCRYSAITVSCNQASDAGVVCIGKLIESINNILLFLCNQRNIRDKVLKMYNYVHSFCMVRGRIMQMCTFQAWGRA